MTRIIETPKLEPGTYSHGTLRMEDLTDMVSTIAGIVECYVCKRNHRGMLLSLNRYNVLFDGGRSDLASVPADIWIERFSEWIDHTESAHVPSGFWFGTHPGDGSDYGVWLSDEIAERVEAIEIRYTATLFTPDDSDTNVYGEPCESGFGENMVSGWVRNPSDPFDVDTDEGIDPANVDPVRLDIDDVADQFGGNVDKAIRSELGDVLGAVDSFDGSTAYASDPIIDYRTGRRVMLAGHVIDPHNPD